MAKKTPVAWVANDGRLLRAFSTVASASRETGYSETLIHKAMEKPNTNFRKPTLKDLEENYIFELGINEVNNELAFLMSTMQLENDVT